LILRKIIKTVAARCHIIKIKCTKFDFGWASTPDPAGGAWSSPQTPYLNLRGHIFITGRGGRKERDRGKCEEGKQIAYSLFSA